MSSGSIQWSTAALPQHLTAALVIMATALPALFFISGAVIGSFLNVVIVRFRSGRGIVWARSACPHCQQVLRWWELIPIISFALLGGKCQRCGGRIAWQYPLLELVTGLLAVRLLMAGIGTPLLFSQSLVLLAIACLLLVLGLIDLKTFLLPDHYIIGLMGLVGVYLYLHHQSWEQSLMGIAVGAGFLLFLWLITRGQGIGLGDVKLMVPLGALFGPLGMLTLLSIAFGGGALMGSWLLVRQRATMKTAVPFGPFLTLAALLLLLWPTLPTLLWARLWP